ncbi:MAG: Hsp70 family protein [Mycobacterium sp.]|nr:Hsp70 family protein [Mycobacterium sp.]
MADGERSALGLSVGATNLAAVTAGRAVTRKPVLTLYRQRPPEVGVPSENPMLNEPGLVITDFVNRVGDPAGILASDGAMHRGETLVADALRALAYTTTDGWALPAAVAVTYPAHWRPGAVDALQLALSRLSEWSGSRPALLPDSAAALTALQSSPGVPSRGIIAVCDFGGSGTSLTLVDAANDYRPIAPTVRHAEFSGDLIDQALLTHVVAELSSIGSFDASATSAIGSLNQLRAACRHAKEELSSITATTLTADVPGYHGDIRITRAELDEAIRQPLDGFVAVVQDALQRNRFRVADLVAVASVGGGASIPAVTTRLSQYLRAPVITTPRPHMTAAIGAALRATRGAANNGDTALAPTAAGAGSVADVTTKIGAVSDSSPAAPLAWSEVGDESGIMPIRAGEYPEQGSNAVAPAAQLQPVFDRGAQPSTSSPAGDAWYRRPVVLIVGTALVVLAIGAAIMIALRHTSGGAPSTPAPSVSTTPESPDSADQSPAPSGTTDTQAPPNSSPSSTGSDTMAPSSTTTTQAPTTTTQAPTTTTQAPTTTTQAPTTTTQAPTTTQEPQQPVIPPIPRIPGIPRFLPQQEPGNG